MKIRIILGISIVLTLILSLYDLRAFKIGFYCIQEIPSNFYHDLAKYSYLLCCVNFIFKVIGVIICLMGIYDFVKNTKKINLRIKLVVAYLAFALILMLPIYHWHGDGWGSGSHGHSFLDGGFHFH